jgi:quinolinate synthase
MKMITLEGTLESLRLMKYEITLPEEVRQRAEKALVKMLELGA